MKDTANHDLRQRSRRGRPRRSDPAGPGLSEIIEAVVALAGTDGCTDINMRDVAAALNVSPKLLYRYVSGKAEMLDLAASSVLEKWEPPVTQTPWPERLTTIIRDTQRLLHRYPALTEPALLRTLMADGSPQAIRIVAAITDCLCEAGLSPAEAEQSFILYAVLALGELTLNRAIAYGTMPPDRTPSAAMIATGLEAALRLVISGILANRGSDVTASPPSNA